MNDLFKKVLNFMSKNEIALTPQQIADLTDLTTPNQITETKPIINMQNDLDINHNRKVIAEEIEKFQKTIQDLTTQLDNYKTQNDELKQVIGKQIERAENAEKLMQEKAQKERETQITTIIESMKKDGKIAAEAKESEANWINLLKTDYDNTMKIIETLPATTTTQQTKTPDIPTGLPSGFGTSGAMSPLRTGIDPKIQAYLEKSLNK